jgi:protein SCO1
MNTNRLLLACLLAAGVPAWCDQKFQAEGLVLGVDKAQQTVTISHDSIPGFMDAMVMPFHARERKEIENLRPGTMVGFTLVVGKTSSYISGINVHPYHSAERDPQQNVRLKALDEAMHAKSSAAPEIEPGKPVPDFTLADQNNRPAQLSGFKGQVVAITFIYTRCPLPDYCLRMSNNFARLARRFKDRLGRDVTLLSITFDPEHDRPEVLLRYSATWKPDPNGWRFLTGTLSTVKQVSGMFGMNFWQDEGLLTHSLHTVVIDREGKLVANLEGNHFSAGQLGDLVEATMKQGAKAITAK